MYGNIVINFNRNIYGTILTFYIIHVNLIHAILVCVILRMFSLSQARLYTALSRKKSFQIFHSGSGTISQTIGSVPVGAS